MWGQAQVGDQVTAVIGIPYPVGYPGQTLRHAVYSGQPQRDGLNNQKLYQDRIVREGLTVRAEVISLVDYPVAIGNDGPYFGPINHCCH